MTPVWDLVDGFCTWAAARAVLEAGLDGSDAARVQPLLALLASSGLAARDGDRWTLDEGALRLLVAAPGPVEAWLALPATLRTGAPTVAVDDDPVAFYAGLAAATAPVQRAVADAVVPTLGLPAGATVLDLGCGAAPWAAAVLAADAAATAVCVDLPGVVELAAGERRTLVAGDHLTVELDSFDLVVLGHVLRAEDDDRAAGLVARAASVLRPGGTVVVTEYLLDDDGLGPPAAVRMAATVAATLRHGRVRTRSEVRELLAVAGLAVVDEARHEPTDVLVAKETR